MNAFLSIPYRMWCKDDTLENLKYYLRVKKLHYFNIYAYTLKNKSICDTKW